MDRAWTCPARLCALVAALALIVLSLGVASPATAVTPGLDRGSSEAAHENNADRKAESTSTTTAATTGGDGVAADQGSKAPAATSAKSSSSSKSTEPDRGSTKSTSAKGGGSAKASTHTKIGTSGTSGVTTEEQPVSNADHNTGGANGQCSDTEPDAGVYCSTRDGTESGNGQGVGKATGKPCAGCVGKADNKNPPGQMPNARDDGNNGYECDDNNGIGHGKVGSKDGATSAGNPAHTGCVSGSLPPPPPPPPCCDTPPPPPCCDTPPGQQGNPPPTIGGEDEFGAPRPPTVAGVEQFAGPPPAVAPQAGVLPATGAASMSGWLTTLGIGLLLMGATLIGLRRHSLVTARR